MMFNNWNEKYQTKDIADTTDFTDSVRCSNDGQSYKPQPSKVRLTLYDIV